MKHDNKWSVVKTATEIYHISWEASQLNLFIEAATRGVLPEACNFIKKETLAQVLSCEFCAISKNAFFCETHLVAASDTSSASTANDMSISTRIINLK